MSGTSVESLTSEVDSSLICCSESVPGLEQDAEESTCDDEEMQNYIVRHVKKLSIATKVFIGSLPAMGRG